MNEKTVSARDREPRLDAVKTPLNVAAVRSLLNGAPGKGLVTVNTALILLAEIDRLNAELGTRPPPYEVPQRKPVCASCGAPDLTAIRARCEKAMRGPWVTEPNTMAGRVWVRMAHHSDLEPNTDASQKRNHWSRIFAVRSHRDHYGSMTQQEIYEQRIADAEFIAHCREDIPALLDECERLNKIVAAVEAQVEVYDSFRHRGPTKTSRAGVVADLRRALSVASEAL